MAEGDDQMESLDRLEQALARIEADHAARATLPPPPSVPPQLAARLDAVIARLRAGLEG